MLSTRYGISVAETDSDTALVALILLAIIFGAWIIHRIFH